jgi:hypothetical protein
MVDGDGLRGSEEAREGLEKAPEESGSESGQKTASGNARKRNRTTFGPDNPPPKSPGRPKKNKTIVVPPEPVLEDGKPAHLAACEAAILWTHDELPQNPLVRHYVEIKQKSPLALNTVWRRLSDEFEAGQKGQEEEKSVDRPPDEDDPTSDKVIASLEDWLERHRKAALKTAAELSTGKRAK